MKVSPYLMRPLRTLDEVLDDNGGEPQPAQSDSGELAEAARQGEGGTEAANRALASAKKAKRPIRNAAAE